MRPSLVHFPFSCPLRYIVHIRAYSLFTTLSLSMSQSALALIATRPLLAISAFDVLTTTPATSLPSPPGNKPVLHSRQQACPPLQPAAVAPGQTSINHLVASRRVAHGLWWCHRVLSASIGRVIGASETSPSAGGSGSIPQRAHRAGSRCWTVLSTAGRPDNKGWKCHLLSGLAGWFFKAKFLTFFIIGRKSGKFGTFLNF